MTASNLAPKMSAKLLGDARWSLVERIAASQHLKSSARLREFLFYIAECAIREAPEDATEQQIGVRIFHRTPGYNSSEDSIVRTHARLLRQKLAAYFAEEGLHEKLIVEIPKGHYLPVFQPGDQELQAAHTKLVLAAPEVSASVSKAVLPSARSPRLVYGLLLVIVVVAAAGGAAWFWHPVSRQATARTAVDKFWQPFFTNDADDPPLVVFSNALFVGNSTDGLRYAPQQMEPATQGTGNLVDTYTGIGELASVYMLTRLFDAHHAQFILKRSLLMTWDEAQAKNLIFIGSTAEDASLRVLQSTKDFSMMATPDSAGVVNHHPKAGEPAMYSRPEHPLKIDYAILALRPGVQPGTRMLIFSGLTTFGTQAAVEYVCHPETTAALLKQITDSKGQIHPFEAVLETTIGGGVPLETHLVTIRVH
ncbi:MAG: hypothetical protein WBD10_05000 [Acidobacteriaceae bacterium]